MQRQSALHDKDGRLAAAQRALANDESRMLEMDSLLAKQKAVVVVRFLCPIQYPIQYCGPGQGTLNQLIS